MGSKNLTVKGEDVISGLAKIAENVEINSERDRTRYSMWLGADVVVTKEGFENRNSFAAMLFQDKKVASNWSEEGLFEIIDNSIRSMGNSVRQGEETPTDEIAKDFLAELDKEFEESDWYLPVIGLKLEEELVIGNITFYPYKSKIQELEEHTLGGLLGISRNIETRLPKETI